MSSESWCCERADCNAKGEQQGKLTQHHDHCSNRSEAFADEAITCQSKLGPTTETVPTLKDNGIDQRCIVADGLDVNMRDDDSRKRTHDEATSPNKRNDDDATGSSCSTSNGDLDDRNRETMKDDGYMTKVVSNGDSGEAKKRKVQVEDGITLFRTTSIQMPATSSSNAAASTVHHAHEPAAAGIARPPLALTTSEATNDKQAVTHGLPLDLLAAPHTSFGSAKSLINATKGHIDAPRPLRKAPAFGNVRQSSPNTLSNANHAFDDTESDGKAALDKHQHDNDDKEHAGKQTYIEPISYSSAVDNVCLDHTIFALHRQGGIRTRC
ncbi:hypothetical protein MPSEU_000338500 [Mayamaea pseudoterrestris]|nr:hypothetical protein MPSEU_000338500 [Mayamaea pseudoterrestris]